MIVNYDLIFSPNEVWDDQNATSTTTTTQPQQQATTQSQPQTTTQPQTQQTTVQSQQTTTQPQQTTTTSNQPTYSSATHRPSHTRNPSTSILPPNPGVWKKAETEQGRIYYYHTVTKETKWDLPDELKEQLNHSPPQKKHTRTQSQLISGTMMQTLLQTQSQQGNINTLKPNTSLNSIPLVPPSSLHTPPPTLQTPPPTLQTPSSPTGTPPNPLK